MKWINHKIITFSTVYLLTGNFLSSCIAAAGSVVPDLLEGRFDFSAKVNLGNKNRKNSLPKWHRTVTHWFPVYLFIMLFSLLHFRGVDTVSVANLSVYLVDLLSGTSDKLFYFILFWLSFGSFMHIIQDSLTGRVPLFNPFRKSFTMKIMRTGSVVEYLLSLIFAGVALLVYVLM